MRHLSLTSTDFGVDPKICRLFLDCHYVMKAQPRVKESDTPDTVKYIRQTLHFYAVFVKQHFPLQRFFTGAQRGGRTLTLLPASDFESDASANSAIWALTCEKLEPSIGLEPTTHALRKHCSTN